MYVERRVRNRCKVSAETRMPQTIPLSFNLINPTVWSNAFSLHLAKISLCNTRLGSLAIVRPWRIRRTSRMIVYLIRILHAIFDAVYTLHKIIQIGSISKWGNISLLNANFRDWIPISIGFVFLALNILEDFYNFVAITPRSVQCSCRG